MQIHLWQGMEFSGYMPVVKYKGHMVVLVLIFWKLCKLISTMVVLICTHHHHQWMKLLFSPHPLQHLLLDSRMITTVTGDTLWWYLKVVIFISYLNFILLFVIFIFQMALDSKPICWLTNFFKSLVFNCIFW